MRLQCPPASHQNWTCDMGLMVSMTRISAEFDVTHETGLPLEFTALQTAPKLVSLMHPMYCTVSPLKRADLTLPQARLSTTLNPTTSVRVLPAKAIAPAPVRSASTPAARHDQLLTA